MRKPARPKPHSFHSRLSSRYDKGEQLLGCALRKLVRHAFVGQATLGLAYAANRNALHSTADEGIFCAQV